MCRLLGVVSTTARPLTTLLADDLPHFTGLSSEHCDGWGIAHWDARDGLTVRKAAEAAQPSAAYHEALRGTRTDAALLHLRKASDGMVNSDANTHPFVSGDTAFAHNGWISDPAGLDALNAAAGGRPCAGTTDSERYFGLLLAAMRTLSPEEALTAVSAQVYATMRAEALNCLLLTEEALYAFTSFDPTRPTASGRNPFTSYQLGFRVGPDSVVVASSGWEPSGTPWEPLPNGQILRVRRRDLHTSVHRLVPEFATAALGRSAAPVAVAG